ncbi:MAG: PQQ-binding-like beta-propeller repeat protein [Kiritimatiellae bacterium]|nr:PQQ-binding-like beta-propeller repeat protein [Kiritimatiellia bacterium]
MRDKYILNIAASVSFKLFTSGVFISLVCYAHAGDWPMWRCDSGRTAVSTEQLPDGVPGLVWKRSFSPRVQVWDSPLNNYLMQYDKAFEPIVSGQTLMVGFNDSDKLIAIDTRTGENKWTFYCDGPIRLAPAASNNKVYFGSDDGCFYCVDIATGKEVWKFQAAPAERRLIGNRRIISMWPIRGGPVIEEGTVYFSAGIWPFMGVFIYALDAETGKVVWLNDHDSIRYQAQPHKPSMAFAGVAPQGAFVVIKDKLLVPGGRSIPAIVDRNTGNIVRYDFDKYTKYLGGDFVAAIGGVYYTRARDARRPPGATQFDISSGSRLLKKTISGMPVLEDGIVYFSGDEVAAFNSDSNGKLQSTKPLWSLRVDAGGDLIKAGNRLYAAGKGKITAIDVAGERQAKKLWEVAVDGDVVRLIAADDRLFAVTADGDIMAFGQGRKNLSVKEKGTEPLGKYVGGAKLAEVLLAQTESRSGWAFVNGLDALPLIEALLSKTEHKFVVLDRSAEKVKKAREYLDSAGVYGSRISVHVGTPSSFDLAPYAIELAVSSSGVLLDKADVAKLLNNLRPYGGVLFVLNTEAAGIFTAALSEKGYRVVKSSAGTTVTREGALKGAASWTHNYGSIAQSAKSDDKVVKLPLGILWWGGSSNMDVLPRHAHGPGEQVIGGRLFIQGIDSFSARDVYTGRVLWKRELRGLNKEGIFFTKTYDPDPLVVGYNQMHFPGANVRGANFVATEDKVYLIQDEKCLVLDSVTGKSTTTIYLPEKANWGYIGIYGDILIGGVDFSNPAKQPSVAVKNSKFNIFHDIYKKSMNRKLVMMNRNDGRVMWTSTAKIGYPNNGITVGGNKLFVLDRQAYSHISPWKRKEAKESPACIKVFDLKSGKELWSRSEGVFGTFLSYSVKHNIVLLSNRPSRDMVPGEAGTRMAAFKGMDGSVMWQRDFKYATFPIIHTDTIISESGRWDLLTGKSVGRINPVTGEAEPWTWKRTYGCNYPVASEYLLTFRSGAASFYDLVNDGGTGSFGGFKSGCSANLIAADGVLNAPEYTRTCNCSYQNQSSLAMVHMPEIEFWTTTTISKPGVGGISRIGLNFGAPGDRKFGETYWVDYPSVGGQSPDPDISVNSDVKWNLGNAARFGKGEYNWVYSSCAENISEVKVNLGKGAGGQASSGNQGKEVLNENSIVLVSKSAEWAYLAGKQPVNNWKTVGFDDSSWKFSEAGFGYGDGDDQTKLSDMQNKYTSVYIRKEFNIDDPKQINSLDLMVGYDDYFIAYINGKRVAFAKKNGHERTKDKWSRFNIAGAGKILVKGLNVIAIEGHNINAASSDFSLDPYLTAGVSGKQSDSKVIASGGTNAKSSEAKKSYTVRLYFAEPEQIDSGVRVFDLFMNNTKVLSSFDVTATAGGARKGVVKEFKDIQCVGELNLIFVPRAKEYGAIISGVEIVRQK